MGERVIYSDSDNFERDVLRNPLPVVLDFYSEDCPPCEALAPALERLAERYGDRVAFVKIYRQKNRPLAESLGVRSSPTVLFFRNGKEVGRRLSGYISKAELRQAIEETFGTEVKSGERKRVEADLIILGAGPAGLSAAIYAGRAKLNTVVVEEGLPGGQAATTYHIANYPGTPGVIRGRELMDNMLRQALSFGVRVDDYKEVAEVDLVGEIKKVVTEDTDYYAPALIIATGAKPRLLPAEGEDTFRGRGVHYCATCDGAMYQGRRVIVVGGGNSAVEEAVFLTRFAEHVTIVHQFDHFQASRVAQEEALRHPKIDVIWESEVRRVIGEGHVTAVEIENLRTGERREIPTDGVFVYIGTRPATELFRGQVAMNEDGYIITDAEMATDIEGVFAAGDVRAKAVRQAITAAADGAIAGINAEKYVTAKRAVVSR